MALAVVTAAAAAVTYPETRAEQRQEAAQQASLNDAPAAEVKGESRSPNGRFEVRTAGELDLWISGVRVPEALQILDTETGEILWEDIGYVSQTALWSPGNNLVAIACGARTWGKVYVVDTESWTKWEFTLPDGSPIPEYLFFPEDWGLWLDEDTLRVTLGREAEEQHTYRCSLLTEGDGHLTGSVLEETAEVLSENYDFDHDGVLETTELVTVLTPETEYFPAWYILRVVRQDGAELWTTTAHWSHPGWTSVFACEIGGQDYLLQYEPEMWQGWADYSYRLFSLNAVSAAGTPEEWTLRENSVTWDSNYGMDGHQSNSAALADFLEEVHGYLDQGTLLLSTEGGEFRTGSSGAAFRLDMDLWDAFCPYDETRSLLENLESLEQVLTAARQAAEMKAEQGVI